MASDDRMASDPPIILLDAPDITGDLVRALAERGGARIARRRNGEDLRGAVHRSGAQVVVVAAVGDEVPLECRELLRERAELRIVAVAMQGRSAVVSWLHPQITRISDVSTERLLAEVRGEA
jgi:hypothetical protein